MRNGICIFFIAFSIALQAQNFEQIKDFEDILVETDEYNMSSVVEGETAFYFAHRSGGPSYFSSNRFQFSKTDLSGNTIFHKEILAPTNVEFNWGFNHATPPPITFGGNRISIVLAAYSEMAPYTPFLYQFIFDTDGNIIHQNTFDTTQYQEFSNIAATTDGFVFISTEASANTNDNPASLHLFKSDFDGNMLWQKQYQFLDGINNTMYAKALTFDSSGNIYVAVFQIPLDSEDTQATVIFKLDSSGELIFVKRYLDESNFTGAVRNISLAFDSFNLSEELYIMSSWASVLNTNHTDLFKLNTDGEVLASKQLVGVQFGSTLISSIIENGCSALIGKKNNDGITNSFANNGDPILINFNTDLSINWSYAYGGETIHFTDDLVGTKDGGYLILARSNAGDYLIKTDGNGSTVCETVTPSVTINDLDVTVDDKEVYALGSPMELIDTPIFDLINIPFYEPEDKCCPGGIPTVGFEYNYSSETGLVSFNNTSINSDAFNWSFDDGNNSFDTNPNHEYLANGVYEVCLTAENECGTNFYCEEITLESIGLADWSMDPIKISSHNNGINITSDKVITIALYNVVGQIFFMQENVTNSIHINKPISGIYYCKIIHENKLLTTEKIIVL